MSRKMILYVLGIIFLLSLSPLNAANGQGGSGSGEPPITSTSKTVKIIEEFTCEQGQCSCPEGQSEVCFVFNPGFPGYEGTKTAIRCRCTDNGKCTQGIFSRDCVCRAPGCTACDTDKGYEERCYYTGLIPEESGEYDPRPLCSCVKVKEEQKPGCDEATKPEACTSACTADAKLLPDGTAVGRKCIVMCNESTGQWEDRCIFLDEVPVQNRRSEIADAVQKMVNAESRMGGIGPQVSQLAREYNASSKNVEMAREKIQQRNRIMKFFMGNDMAEVAKMEQEYAQNQVRIENMKTLVQRVTNAAERTALQNEIAALEQEQTQLRLEINAAKEEKGLFGFIK